MESDTIFLPVSLGEAIDKLTILDIKLSNIKDSRITDVKLEYELLKDKLHEYVEKYKPLYTCMKNINMKIWDFMNNLRDGELKEDSYLSLCKKTIEYNDIRFRIKNKINMVSGSILKEQKGYKINSIFIEINCVSDIQNFIIPPIRYLSLLYDLIVIKYEGSNILRETFKEDTTIVFQNEIEEYTNFKKQYKFMDRDYTKEDVLNEFNLTEEIIDSLIR
jgi:hypothetical protein